MQHEGHEYDHWCDSDMLEIDFTLWVLRTPTQSDGPSFCG